MGYTIDDFRDELENILVQAEQLDLSAIEMTSGALHRRVGGYPGQNHAMPSCCNAMRQAMQADRDTVVAEPEKGAGASLTIRYVLPRR